MIAAVLPDRLSPTHSSTARRCVPLQVFFIMGEFALVIIAVVLPSLLTDMRPTNQQLTMNMMLLLAPLQVFLIMGLKVGCRVCAAQECGILLNNTFLSCTPPQVFFIMGEFALVIIAVALPSWRGQFAAGAVLCAASLLLWPLLPESGRWLYVQGRTHEAMEVSGMRDTWDEHTLDKQGPREPSLTLGSGWDGRRRGGAWGILIVTHAPSLNLRGC
jgi:hypothetical protein